MTRTLIYTTIILLSLGCARPLTTANHEPERSQCEATCPLVISKTTGKEFCLDHSE